MDVNILLFFIAVCFWILTSVGILSFFRFHSLLEQIISFLIISSANIIIATLILSFLDLINRNSFLIIHAIFLLMVFLIIRLTGRKFLLLFVQVNLSEFKDIKKHPHIIIFGVSVLVFCIVSIFIILFVPPNNWDSMTYHLSRIGFWLQHGSLGFFDTYNLTQNYSPPNAEILIMWSILFIKSDIFAGFIQFIGYLGTILLIYGIAREIGANIFQGIFASLVWASIPEVMLEATSTQNDIVATFFSIATIFFILRGCNELGWRGFLVSGISLGLAVGTKATAILALPGIFVGTLFLFIKMNRTYLNKTQKTVEIPPHPPLKKGGGEESRTVNDLVRNLTNWIMSASLGIIIFGSYIYKKNYLYYGYPFSTQAVKADATAPSIANIFYNLYHIGYRFLDTSGIPFLEIPVFFNARYFHEDYAGYGLVWLFLGVPAVFYALYRGFFKNDFLKMWICIIAVGYLLSFSFALSINPHIFRLLIFFTAIICPLVAFFYPKEITIFYSKEYNSLNWRRALFTLITTVGVISIFVSAFFNLSKPFYLPFSDKKTIFEKSFYEKRFFFPSKKDTMIIFQELDKMAEKGSRVGVIASTDDWDYPAFGRRFDRIVVPILLRKVNVNEDIFARYNLDYLIVFGQVQNIESVKVDVMPFITQLKKSGSLNTLRAGNMFLFAKKSAL